MCIVFYTVNPVSTHSRPKAAGFYKLNNEQLDLMFQHTAARRRLAVLAICENQQIQTFQHTAARRRLDPCFHGARPKVDVSTHSRPKAAGVSGLLVSVFPPVVSTHSRPKAAGKPCKQLIAHYRCFNTQPPEGGWLRFDHRHHRPQRFQHTAARRRLAILIKPKRPKQQFQHTAARRRLEASLLPPLVGFVVSTHSRPKAAGIPANRATTHANRFNTQPPEGGWFCSFASLRLAVSVSTHSRPKAAGEITTNESFTN